MKKTLIALAAVAAATGAMAQATISGTINVGIIDTGAPGDRLQVNSLGGGANAINIATTEDLGGGLRGGFDSQIRFNAATGNSNNNKNTDWSGGAGNSSVHSEPSQFHAINAFVGGAFGTVRVGRIAEASNCAFDPWGCAGGAALSAGNGISALVGANSQARSISYTSPTVSGFSASYQTTMSPRTGASGGRTTERTVLALNYAQGPIALQLLDVKGGPNTASATVAIADEKSKARSVAGSYDFGVARVSLTNATSKSAAGVTTANINSIGVTVPMGAITILGGYNKDSKAAKTADTKMSLGVNYALSKRTTLGADVFKAEGLARITGTTGTDTAGTGYVVRVRHTF